ncbi:hypothetical protein E2C01_034968 [Portunus trituberculatus]|uniref:Uncharacterized protein n=1 Tax=Portunus trituberculatus TaxID=210409 RepID=A0A5B7F823_PORTR|nr:hypothetical protein [Portunus trituberculatus]
MDEDDRYGWAGVCVCRSSKDTPTHPHIYTPTAHHNPNTQRQEQTSSNIYGDKVLNSHARVLHLIPDSQWRRNLSRTSVHHVANKVREALAGTGVQGSLFSHVSASFISALYPLSEGQYSLVVLVKARHRREKHRGATTAQEPQARRWYPLATRSLLTAQRVPSGGRRAEDAQRRGKPMLPRTSRSHVSERKHIGQIFMFST